MHFWTEWDVSVRALRRRRKTQAHQTRKTNHTNGEKQINRSTDQMKGITQPNYRKSTHQANKKRKSIKPRARLKHKKKRRPINIQERTTINPKATINRTKSAAQSNRKHGPIKPRAHPNQSSSKDQSNQELVK